MNLDDKIVAENERKINPQKISEKHLAEWVEGSGCDPEIACLNVETVTDNTEIARGLDYKAYYDGSGFWVSGVDPETGDRTDLGAQFKPDKPKPDKKTGKTRKYLSRKGEAQHPLFLEMPDENYWQKVLANPSIPIFITEGAKKAGALLSRGYAAFSIPGVDTHSKDGRLKPILEKFCCVGRKVHLVFDADLVTKKGVGDALDRLGRYIASQGGATVYVLTWDESQGKGIDDFLVNGGDFESLLATAQTFQEWRKSRQDAELPLLKKKIEMAAVKRECGKAQKNTPWRVLEVCNYEIGFWGEYLAPRDPGAIPEAWIDNPGIQLTTNSKGVSARFFEPKTDFDFHVERVVQDSDGGGLYLRIERLSGGLLATHCVYVSSQQCNKVVDFVSAVKRGLGVNVSCLLSLDELQRLLHDRREKYMQNRGKVYKRVDRIGQQPDGTYVFENCQITNTGKDTSEEESKWVFNPDLGGEDECIPSPEIAEPNPDGLKDMVANARRFLGPGNFMKAAFLMGWAAMGLHFQKIMEVEKSFPLINAVGDPGSNKTLAAQCALSLIGMHNRGIVTRVSESALYELLKSYGGVSIFVDDPPKGSAIEEICKDVFNAKPRRVRGNHQQPYSSMGITSNHAIGDESPATRRRIIRVFFDVSKDGDRTAFQALRKSWDGASGSLSQLIALGYPKCEVDALELTILKHLPNGHESVAKSLAMVAVYTQKLLNLAGIQIDVANWVIQTMCPSANDDDSAIDSLSDFLLKLKVLQTNGRAGDWNVKRVSPRDGKEYYAIYLEGLWQEFEREFKPIYSKSVIRRLITEKGGMTSRQKFPTDREYWRRYQMEIQLNPESQATPPEFTAKACLLVPVSVLKEAYRRHGYGGTDAEVTVSEPEVTPNFENSNSLETSSGGGLSTSSYSSYSSYSKKERDIEKEVTPPTPPGRDTADSEVTQDVAHFQSNWSNWSNLKPETDAVSGIQELPQHSNYGSNSALEIKKSNLTSNWTPQEGNRVEALTLDKRWKPGSVARLWDFKLRVEFDDGTSQFVFPVNGVYSFDVVRPLTESDRA